MSDNGKEEGKAAGCISTMLMVSDTVCRNEVGYERLQGSEKVGEVTKAYSNHGRWQVFEVVVGLGRVDCPAPPAERS